MTYATRARTLDDIAAGRMQTSGDAASHHAEPDESDRRH